MTRVIARVAPSRPRKVGANLAVALEWVAAFEFTPRGLTLAVALENSVASPYLCTASRRILWLHSR